MAINCGYVDNITGFVIGGKLWRELGNKPRHDRLFCQLSQIGYALYRGDAIYAAIQDVAGLKELAKKPVMTRFIAELSPKLLADQAAGRPINAATIYGHLFNKALLRDGKKRVRIQPRDRQKMLESLAVYYWRRQTTILTIDDLEEWFDDYVEQNRAMRNLALSAIDARDLLQTELRNASLLVRQNQKEFSFVDRSFQEYFLALAVRNALLGGVAEILDIPASFSREALRFLIDSALRDNRLLQVGQASSRVLASNCSIEARQKAFVFLRAGRDHGWNLPAGANFSDFELSEVVARGETLLDIDFRSARLLLGARFSDVLFINCHFGENFSDVRFDNCSFENCSGTPN